MCNGNQGEFTGAGNTDGGNRRDVNDRREQRCHRTSNHTNRHEPLTGENTEQSCVYDDKAGKNRSLRMSNGGLPFIDILELIHRHNAQHRARAIVG